MVLGLGSERYSKSNKLKDFKQVALSFPDDETQHETFTSQLSLYTEAVRESALSW